MDFIHGNVHVQELGCDDCDGTPERHTNLTTGSSEAHLPYQCKHKKKCERFIVTGEGDK